MCGATHLNLMKSPLTIWARLELKSADTCFIIQLFSGQIKHKPDSLNIKMSSAINTLIIRPLQINKFCSPEALQQLEKSPGPWLVACL